VRALIHCGGSVVSLSAGLDKGRNSDVADGLLNHVRADIRDYDAIRRVVVANHVDAIVHSAALVTGDPESLDKPAQYLAINASATWALAELVREVGVRRLLAVSSRAVYGGYEAAEGPVAEDAAFRPLGFYGASKAAADVVLRIYREHLGVDVVIARVTGNFEPWQSYPTPLVRMIDAAVTGAQLRLPLPPDYVYEFNYVKDTARGLLTLLNADRPAHAVYNVGCGEQRTLAELAEIVCGIVPGTRINLVGSDTVPPPRAGIAVDRLFSEFGFVPRWSFEAAVAETLEWRRSGAYGEEI